MRTNLMRTNSRRITALVGAAVLLMVTAVPVAAAEDEFVIVFPQQHESTRYLSDFGVAKPDGRTHRGVDIHSPKGSPVLAVADGVITKLTRSPRAGNYIVIAHADGWESWYLHLNNDRIRVDGVVTVSGPFAEGLDLGSYVAAGDVIGYVGDSGNAAGTDPHTHFELHNRGRAINPYRYLVAAEERWLLESRIEAGETPYR
ncbi:MAG: M23 family metallopeptidase [Acidimicrobiia bacterium]|nr:M23 family metallopeptidase [Acidimicrobiia bacterium]